MNFFINIGVYKYGMNLILSCKMWKIVVVLVVFYGCELWIDIFKKFLENFEIL